MWSSPSGRQLSTHGTNPLAAPEGSVPYPWVMELSSVAREMFRLYREGRFQDGVSLVVRARESLPEQDGRLTFWEACLRAMAGESDRAVEVLSDGTKRGLWWPEGMLADTDLDSARGQQGWRDLVAACREQEIARLAERPAVQVRGGSGAGTLLALHGAHADPVDSARQWETAVPEAWTVITPVGDVPVPEGGWSWSHGQASRTSEVMKQIENASLSAPLLVAGFSTGANLAVELPSTRLHPEGLILLAPFLGDIDEFKTTLAAVEVPVLLAYGTDDSAADTYRELTSLVADAIAFEGLGHILPTDLAAVFQRAGDLVS